MRLRQILLGLTLGTIVAGCAVVQKQYDGLFGSEEQAGSFGTAQGQVYYSGADGLPVRAEAAGSSKIVGRLSLHQKVTRSRLEHGYAYVTTEDGSLAGWVDNAKLDWRAPSVTGGAAPAVTGKPADAAVTPPAPGDAPSAPAAASPTAVPEAPDATAVPSDPTPAAAPPSPPVSAQTPVAAPTPQPAPPAPSAAVPAERPASRTPAPSIFDPF